MTETSSTNPVSLFHPLGTETVKQISDRRNIGSNINETTSLKSLANKVLQRNRTRNKHETNALKVVSRTYVFEAALETKQLGGVGSSALIEDLEERIAIAQYDGQQSEIQAHRIAYQGAIVAVLNANPPNDEPRSDQDWLMERVKAAQASLITQGITQPR